MPGFNEENAVEKPVIDAMVEVGWTYRSGPSIARASNDVLNEQDLRAAWLAP